MQLSQAFVEQVHEVFGDRGQRWLGRLAGVVDQCRDRWGLRDGVVCSQLSMSYIEFATAASGQRVALKVGVPHPELFTEMEALGLYNGCGAVRLLDADRQLGALLMQRVQPGTMLWQLGDNQEQTGIAASVMRELPVPVPVSHHLPTFSQWVGRAFRLARTQRDRQECLPRDLIDMAEQAFEHIKRSADDDVVLHGDLHHENILLDDQCGWLAIDPKGVIGPRCLEVGRFLQNQLPASRPAERREQILRQRIEIFSAELGHCQQIIAASGLVDCVLCQCWALADGNPNRDLELPRMLGRMC